MTELERLLCAWTLNLVIRQHSPCATNSAPFRELEIISSQPKEIRILLTHTHTHTTLYAQGRTKNNIAEAPALRENCKFFLAQITGKMVREFEGLVRVADSMLGCSRVTLQERQPAAL